MPNNPEQIAARIRELREILEIPVEKIAESLKITKEEYLSYETNEKSIPISALYELAELFNVDFTVLLTGED
ncbi:MAG: helix-turn-helix transcriptional regulator, partial [Victivallales bacterium]|nr:helix-turn-helix transcriptional regulator [Victivallales bacterium]